jgi:DNA primase catalytic subunit
MTKRKDPNKDSRFAFGRTKKRKRRTPEELEEARKRVVRDQRGGNRKRTITIEKNGQKQRLSREDLGMDRRFSEAGRELKKVSDEIKSKDEFRMKVRDKLQDVKSKITGGSITMEQDRMISKLERDQRQVLIDLSNLRSRESSLKVKLVRF